MTEFITRSCKAESRYEVIIKTDSEEHYKATEDFARRLIDHEKPKTNADRIRATDDELATILHAVKMGYRPWCDYHCENEGDDGCDNCIKKWLHAPAEGE